MLSQGINSAFDESFTMLGFNMKIAKFEIYTGAAFLILCGQGLTAAATKNDVL